MLGQPFAWRSVGAPRQWAVFAGLADDQDVDEGLIAAVALYLVLAVVEDNPRAFPDEARSEAGTLATLAGHCRSLGTDAFFSREVFDQEVVRRLCGLGVSEALSRAIIEDVPTDALAAASRLFDLEPGALAEGSDLFDQARVRACGLARERARLFSTYFPSAGMAELVVTSALAGEKNVARRACLVAHPFPALAAALCEREPVELFCPQASATQALSSLADWCFSPVRPAARLRLLLEDEAEGARYDLVFGEWRAWENATGALTGRDPASPTAGSEALLEACAELLAPGGSAVVLASSRFLHSGSTAVRRALLEAGLVDAVIELRGDGLRARHPNESLWVLRRRGVAAPDVLLGQAAGDGLAELERTSGADLYHELTDGEEGGAAVRALADSIAAREPLPLMSERVDVTRILATDAVDLRYTTYAPSVDLERHVRELADGLGRLEGELEGRYRELDETLAELWGALRG